MRKGVIVCGANGERGVILERVVEQFAKKNQSKVVQFSACSIGVSPLMLTMSGVDMTKLISVNGCRNRCADKIVEQTGQAPDKSCVLDDALERGVGACKNTCDFNFPGINEDEIKRFVAIMTQALD
jgi:uncharacterized metal-binding protein